MNIKCEFCKKFIDIEATKCPHCQEWIKDEYKNKIIQETNKNQKTLTSCVTIGCAIPILFFILVAVFIPSQSNKSNEFSKVDAMATIQIFNTLYNAKNFSFFSTDN